MLNKKLRGKRCQSESIVGVNLWGESPLYVYLLLLEIITRMGCLSPKFVSHPHPIVPIFYSLLRLLVRGFDGGQLGQWNCQAIPFPLKASWNVETRRRSSFAVSFA